MEQKTKPNKFWLIRQDRDVYFSPIIVGEIIMEWAPISASEATDRPSMKSIYDSNYYSQVRTEEQQRGNKTFNAAKTPLTTGVVPRPAYADMFQTITDETQPNGQIQSLSGEVLTPKEFSHNNMQPFYRGRSVKGQNVEKYTTESSLERYTGRGPTFQGKKEVESFFAPQKGVTNVCGMKQKSDFYTDRIVLPIARNNDFPIAQVRVGPGLGKGYTANPTGGFQQASLPDLIKYKTVDDLRVTTRPRTVNEGRITAGKGMQTIKSVETIGAVEKNRPDTWYEQNPDQWIKTTGLVKEPRGRPAQLVKPTARQDSHVEYEGAAYGKTAKPGLGNRDDYGKTNIMVYENERDITGIRTVLNNTTSIVKAVVAPLLDIFKHNPKEYTIENAREFGNMNAQIPSKPTIYDPITYVARTTIKETTIHDSSVGNLVAGKDGYTERPEDARPTQRETLPLEDTSRNMSAHTYHTIVYDPEMVARTTMRELSEHSKYSQGSVGNVNNHGAYDVIDFEVKNVSRQFLADNDYTGDGKSAMDFRPMSYQDKYNMEIDETRSAMELSAGRIPGAEGPSNKIDPNDIQMDSKRQDVGIAERAFNNVGKIWQKEYSMQPECTYTKPPNAVPEEDRRLDPQLLDPFRSNPYTKSLTSYA